MIERNYEIIMNYKDLILKDIKKGILLVGTCILLIICCVITMISYSNHRLLDANNQVVIVGNPAKSSRIWELYKRLIKQNQVSLRNKMSIINTI